MNPVTRDLKKYPSIRIQPLSCVDTVSLFSAHSVVRAIFVLQSALVAMKRSGCRRRIVLCGVFSWSCDSSGGCAAGGGCVRGAAGVGGCGRPALSDPVGGRLHAWSGAARDVRESLDASAAVVELCWLGAALRGRGGAGDRAG